MQYRYVQNLLKKNKHTIAILKIQSKRMLLRHNQKENINYKSLSSLITVYFLKTRIVSIVFPIKHHP